MRRVRKKAMTGQRPASGLDITAGLTGEGKSLLGRTGEASTKPKTNTTSEDGFHHLGDGGPTVRRSRIGLLDVGDYEQLSFLPNATRPVSVIPK